MSKGGGTVDTKSTTTVPSYVSDAQQNLLGYGKTITKPFLKTAPTSTVAGSTPDQELAYDATRGLASDAFLNPAITVPSTKTIDKFATPTATAATPARIGTTARSTAADVVAPERIGIDDYSAGPASTASTVGIDLGSGAITSKDVNQWINPYTKQVLDPTIKTMRRELDKTKAGYSAKDASSAAFGGARQALRDTEADSAYADDVASTTGDLYSKAYNNAVDTALANGKFFQGNAMFNAGEQNKANQFNAGEQNVMGRYNTTNSYNAASANAAAQNRANELRSGYQQDTNLANAGAENKTLLSNAGWEQAANLANADAVNDYNKYFTGQYNTMLTSDADRGLTGATTSNTLENDRQKRQLAAIEGLLYNGGAQQKVAQKSLDQPMDMLKLLNSVTPSATGSTTNSTVPDNSPSTLQTVGGLGASLLGAGSDSIFGGLLGGLGLLSDERDKTDIEKLGRDEQTGLDLYAYRYKGDPKSYPKAIGPLAQDIEKRYPDAVREVGGHKIIHNLGMSAPASIQRGR